MVPDEHAVMMQCKRGVACALEQVRMLVRGLACFAGRGAERC